MEWIVGNIMRAAKQAFRNVILTHAGNEFAAFGEAVASLFDTRNPDIAGVHLPQTFRCWERENGPPFIAGDFKEFVRSSGLTQL